MNTSLLVAAGLLFGGVPVAQEAANDVEQEAGQEELVDEQEELDEFLAEDLDDLFAGELGEDDEDSVLQDWKGFFEVRPRVYLHDRGGVPNDEQLLLEAEFELGFRFSEELTGFFRPRVYQDVLDGDLERFEPYEAYVTYTKEDWDLRAGQFVENWGIVDTYNPIDVINRRDFASDFLDQDRLGELGFRLRRFFTGNDTFGEPSAALYVLPVWRETLFAPEDQRFAFDTPGMAFDEDAGFEPSGSERVFYAARVTGILNTEWANADVQALAAYGPERIPAVVVSGTELVPAYYGATTVGAGFRAVPNQDAAGWFLSTLTLKAELVFKSPHDFDDSPLSEPDDFFAYVLGVDRQVYDVLRDQDTLTLTVEYAGEEGGEDLSATFRAFRNDLILRTLWEANDFARTSLEVRGIYDLDTDEVIAETLFERQLRGIHEDLKLTLQFQFFDPPGSGESLLDFFPNNTSIAIGLRWDF